jgi:predicted ester cyclase
MGTEQANEAVVRRFYDELWNEWRLDVADEIVSATIRFRGSLGATLAGRDEFKGYVETIRAAFPDWHNQVDEIISKSDRVVTRMTWTGTHRARLREVEPTGARVEFVGAAFFHVADGLIEEAWVVGDTQELWRALGQLRR